MASVPTSLAAGGTAQRASNFASRYPLALQNARLCG
jgi:hypothetical protein